MVGLIFCVVVGSWILLVMFKAKGLRGTDVSLFSTSENNQFCEVLPMQSLMARRIKINSIEDDTERYKALMSWEKEISCFASSIHANTVVIGQENVVDFRAKKSPF